MSRTDKDVPYDVWHRRAADRRVQHYGCEHDNRTWHRNWTVETFESTEFAWHAVELTIDADPDLSWLACLADGNPARWAHHDWTYTRTVWRYDQVVTTERVRTWSYRLCDLDHPDETRRGRSCDWLSPSYRYKRGPTKDYRRRFHKGVRAETNVKLKKYAADYNSYGESDVDISTANFRWPWWE